MKEALVLIGGGGHCKACIDVIESGGNWSIAGIVDLKEKKGTKVLGYEIIAGDGDIPVLMKKYRNFLVAVGQVRFADKRRDLFHSLKERGVSFPAIISPHALVSRHAELGEGTIVMHGAKINAGARIGRNCIINTSAVIEHDSAIGDHCHIATGSIVNADCDIGEGVLIGSNSVLITAMRIAANTVVGAGSVVIRSIPEPGIYAGNPAKRLDGNG